MLDSVCSEINFLRRDEKWENEKPYRMRYNPPAGLPRTNYNFESHSVNVYDMRPLLPDLSLDKNGFEVHQLQSEMKYSDFSDPQKIKEVYSEEIKNLLQQSLKAQHIHILDYVVRINSHVINFTNCS